MIGTISLCHLFCVIGLLAILIVYEIYSCLLFVCDKLRKRRDWHQSSSYMYIYYTDLLRLKKSNMKYIY